MNDSLGPFNLVLLALPGIGLKLAVWAMYSRRETVAGDPMKILLSTAGSLLLAVAAAGGVLGLIGIPSSPAGFVFYWLPVIGVLLIALLMALDRYRHGEHRALVWSLAAAAQRGIPLAEAARAYADELLGDTGARPSPWPAGWKPACRLRPPLVPLICGWPRRWRSPFNWARPWECSAQPCVSRSRIRPRSMPPYAARSAGLSIWGI